MPTLVGPDGIASTKHISAALRKRLSKDELSEMARVIELTEPRGDGRPEGRRIDLAIWVAVEAMKRRRPDLSIRRICELVAARKGYANITAGSLRKRYLETAEILDEKPGIPAAVSWVRSLSWGTDDRD